jgi:Cof subfamily protein (haloacid dehalogenase superfamily)
LGLKSFPLNMYNIYFICYNGAEIFNKGKLVYKKYLEAERVKNIIEWIYERYPGTNISVEIDNRLYTNFDICIMEGWHSDYSQVDFNTFEYRDSAKILVDLSKIEDKESIAGALPEESVLVVTDKGTLGQIMHKSVSKLNGIKYLTELFECSLEDIIAFGDDYNDIEMISGCGIGVAMGNAEQQVKETADLVTATNDEDGVAKVLREMFLSDIN